MAEEKEIVCEKCGEKSKVKLITTFSNPIRSTRDTLNTPVSEYPKAIFAKWTGAPIAVCPKCGHRNILPREKKDLLGIIIVIAVIVVFFIVASNFK